MGGEMRDQLEGCALAAGMEKSEWQKDNKHLALTGLVAAVGHRKS